MTKQQPGQVLVLVLLIVIVALALGLSVASRNLTNLRTSTQTEQSQRAFSASEGGVENVLSKLSIIAGEINTGLPDPTHPSGCTITAGQASCPVTIGTIQANVNVQGQSTFESKIDLGNVGQIDLNGATGSNIIINWAKSADPLESAEPASIELILIRVDGGGNFAQSRWAFNGGIFTSRDEIGFANPNCSPSFGYAKCARIPLQSGARMLRIKPFWTPTTFQVTSDTGSLPVQNFVIESTATTEIGVTRKVQVTRNGLPQLPAFFDYVLYSGGDIIK